MAKAQKKIIIFEGPSGVGKDVTMNALCSLAPEKFKKIPSYTSRPIRPGETDGITYFFIDEKIFLEKTKSGEIFEHTTRHGTYRGMGKSLILDIINNGRIALKDLDIVGMRAIKNFFPNQVLCIFITANKDVIRQRLEKRGCQDIERRLADYDNVHKNINEYDHVVVDEGPLHESVEKILNILKEYQI